MRSGNHLVDGWDDDQDRLAREKRTLECGCMDYCKCDDGEEEDRFRRDYVEGK